MPRNPSRAKSEKEAAMSKKSSAALAEPAEAETAPALDEDGEEEVVNSTASPNVGAEGAEPELVVLDDEFEFEAEAAEPEGDSDEARPAAKKKEATGEGGGDSMLARYFREMATHPVMGPDE